MPATEQRHIAVLGAAGTTGSRVAERLATSGRRFVAASRSSAHRFDWDDPATWAAVLDGAEAVYLVPPPGPADFDAFVASARRGGVERIVALSARGPDQSGDDHLVGVEAAVTGGDTDWTVLRPAWFAQNFSQGFFRPSLDAGELRLPVGEGREPFIDVDDIADVAVAALTGAGHHGRVYELSGPATLSFGEAVAELGQATGRELQFVPVDVDEFVAEQTGFGVPPEVVTMLVNLFAAIRNGENDHLSSGVHDTLGRPPTPFAEFAARVAQDW